MVLHLMDQTSRHHSKSCAYCVLKGREVYGTLPFTVRREEWTYGKRIDGIYKLDQIW